MKKFTKSVVCLVLLAVLALGITACSEKTTSSFQNPANDFATDHDINKPSNLAEWNENSIQENPSTQDNLDNDVLEDNPNTESGLGEELEDSLHSQENEALFNEIFTKNNGYDYNDYFNFSIDNPDYIYELGSEENEEIFKQILNGNEDYRDFFGWFLSFPEYIYRYNEESLKCLDMVIANAGFSASIKEKYWGLYSNIGSTHPYLPAMGNNGEYYQVYFNADWSIGQVSQCIIFDGREKSGFDLWHYNLPGYTIGDWQYNEVNEIRQLDRFFTPIWNDDGTINSYYLSFSSLLINVDMGDGTMDCSVHATYNLDVETNWIWNGEDQHHQEISFLSSCTVTADFNGVYANGVGGVFERSILFTEEEGIWKLEKVWEEFRESALTANEEPSGSNEQKIVIF